ncbi:MAG: hypothetical protein RL684_1854 [Pseudomonadota bacterium]
MLRTFLQASLPLVAGVTLVSCGSGGSGAGSQATPPGPSALSALGRLGEAIFHDPSLSASGRLACASCHVPEHGHAGADGLAVPLGGAALDQQGRRNAPSLRYLAYTPAFHFEADGTPVGGFDRDGRAATLAQQARTPLLADNEMANGTPQALVTRLAAASYTADFLQVFGAKAFDDAEGAFDSALLALQQYLLEDSAEFAPFSSRYDAWLAGTAALDAQQLRGLALFNDPTKGNCAACHPGTRATDGTPPLFTDFSYDALGVPRNPLIAANADVGYFDLGLCGPARGDLAPRLDLCGAFKVPSLRNVAITAPYFHNGRFATLEEAVSFYARRDTDPQEWYPPADAAAVLPYDDLPALLRINVNRSEVPYDRRRGEAPHLTPQEIADIVAFLGTLTDGYTP